MALSDLTREAVLAAVREFDELSRGAFLKKYGFGEERGYKLIFEGQSYDSKAIAGVAHGYLPDRLPLNHQQFTGGKTTVKPALEGLGFTVLGPGDEDLPVPGEVLDNTEISYRFAVGIMGGMRRSIKLDLLVLISDSFKGLYEDRWEGEVLHYTGMGPIGDQDLSYAQNRTLNESRKTNIPVHLMEALVFRRYTYVGEVEIVGEPYQEEQPDDEGNSRQVWMFPLRVKEGGIIPRLSEAQAHGADEHRTKLARKLSLDELRRRALRGKKEPPVKTVHGSAYVRDAAIAEYAKRLANGICDLCREPAPFSNKRREPYLEAHHIKWLAKGGADTIENTVALCPNCHRKMHVVNRKADRDRLRSRTATRTELEVG